MPAAVSTPRDVPGRAPVAAARSSSRLDDVLDTAERRFRTEGIRAVVMSDLARSLGMSTKTLYRLVPSKEALVAAVVQRWSDRFLDAQAARLDGEMSVLERTRTAAQALVAHRRRFSDDFWSELRAEHPEARSIYTSTLAEARRRADERMDRARREGIDRRLARVALMSLVELAQRPDVLERTGLEATEAIDQVVSLWARGVFVDPDEPPPRA